MPTETEATETVKDETASETQAATETKTLTLAEAQAQLDSANQRIHELNKESAKHRKEADRLKKIEDDRKAAELSETEKLKLDLDKANKAKEDAETKANERLVRSEIMVAAAKLGFADPSDAVALVDKTQLEIGEDGNVKGVEEALKALAKAKPHLVKRNASGTVTNPGSTTGGGETDDQRRRRLGLR